MTIKSKQITMAEAISDPKFSYLDSFADVQDLALLTQETTRILFKMRKLNEQLKEYEQNKASAELMYKKRFRSEYMRIENAKNDTQRKLLAEIACEEEEKKLLINETYVKTIQREINLCKTELDALKTLGFNIRQELQAL